jgi:hypothetical protein
MLVASPLDARSSLLTGAAGENLLAELRLGRSRAERFGSVLIGLRIGVRVGGPCRAC